MTILFHKGSVVCNPVNPVKSFSACVKTSVGLQCWVFNHKINDYHNINVCVKHIRWLTDQSYIHTNKTMNTNIWNVDRNANIVTRIVAQRCGTSLPASLYCDPILCTDSRGVGLPPFDRRLFSLFAQLNHGHLTPVRSPGAPQFSQSSWMDGMTS